MHDYSEIESSHIPPQAIEFEEVVLGALMIEKDALYEVMNILKPEHFYKSHHQVIFETILQLFGQNKPIDILTVSDQLKKNKQLDEIGGYYYITQLTGKVASAAHIEFHAKIIYQKYIQRELIVIGRSLTLNAYDDSIDPVDLIDGATLRFMQFENTASSPQQISETVKGELTNVEKRYKGEKTEGLKTLLLDLDKVLGELEPALIIVAARPSMGKTSLAVQIANNLSCKQNVAGAYFSLEMTGGMVTRWLASQITGIENSNIKKGRLSEDEFNKVNEALYKLSDKPLYVDDSSGYNILSLRSKAIKLKHRHGIKYMIVDYLQLLSGIDKKGRTSNRENEIAEISRGLKGISKELMIPVIALCQLNRKLMDRADKVPVLSDLRESGAIEQDADIVIFIHRPEKYGIQEIENKGHTISSINLAQLLIAKHRDGATGTVLMRFFEETVSFKNFSVEVDNTEYQSAQHKELF